MMAGENPPEERQTPADDRKLTAPAPLADRRRHHPDAEPVEEGLRVLYG